MHPIYYPLYYIHTQIYQCNIVYYLYYSKAVYIVLDSNVQHYTDILKHVYDTVTIYGSTCLKLLTPSFLIGNIRGMINREEVKSIRLWWIIRKSTRRVRSSLILDSTTITTRLPTIPVQLEVDDTSVKHMRMWKLR